MSETTLPLTFAPLREAAEAATRDLLGAWTSGAVHPALWEQDRLTDAHAFLLADLGRPESRLHWVFWLQQQQTEAPQGWTWWAIVSDADSAAALRLAVLGVSGE